VPTCRRGAPVNIVCRLPGPVADLWKWQYDGSCRREDPATFFHPEGERGPSRRDRDSAATAVCLTCPVLQECREHALRVREPYGVWGGMTESQREASYVAPRVLPTAS
jgi:WhiB family redox-sensing transcriptional regulator